MPEFLLERHPAIKYKLKLRKAETIGVFSRNLKVMRDVINSQIMKLYRKIEKQRDLIADMANLYQSLQLSLVNLMP